MVQNKWN